MTGRAEAAAVHIGADVLESPRHATYARLLSCVDTVDRLTRLCHASGITAQRRLLGADATMGRVRDCIVDSAARTGPGGLLVLTFSGHSERAVPGEHDGGWCLRDGTLHHTDTVRLLAAAPPSAHLVVIADTCHAAAFATVFADVPVTIVLVAACGENQTTLNYPVSQFVVTLERLILHHGVPNPDCTSYAWLRQELRRDTPDVERPDIRTNRSHALRWRPLVSQPSG